MGVMLLYTSSLLYLPYKIQYTCTYTPILRMRQDIIPTCITLLPLTSSASLSALTLTLSCLQPNPSSKIIVSFPERSSHIADHAKITNRLTARRPMWRSCKYLRLYWAEEECAPTMSFVQRGLGHFQRLTILIMNPICTLIRHKSYQSYQE